MGTAQQAEWRTSVTCTRADSSSVSGWSCLSLGYSYSYSTQAWLTHRLSPIPAQLHLVYLLKILAKHVNLKWYYLEIWTVYHMPLLGKYWWSSETLCSEGGFRAFQHAACSMSLVSLNNKTQRQIAREMLKDQRSQGASHQRDLLPLPNTQTRVGKILSPPP